MAIVGQRSQEIEPRRQRIDVGIDKAEPRSARDGGAGISGGGRAERWPLETDNARRTAGYGVIGAAIGNDDDLVCDPAPSESRTQSGEEPLEMGRVIVRGDDNADEGGWCHRRPAEPSHRKPVGESSRPEFERYRREEIVVSKRNGCTIASEVTFVELLDRRPVHQSEIFGEPRLVQKWLHLILELGRGATSVVARGSLVCPCATQSRGGSSGSMARLSTHFVQPSCNLYSVGAGTSSDTRR